MTHMRQSRPGSSLGLSHFWYESLRNLFKWFPSRLEADCRISCHGAESYNPFLSSEFTHKPDNLIL